MRAKMIMAVCATHAVLAGSGRGGDAQTAMIIFARIRKSQRFPNACKDDHGRLRVAAATGTGEDGVRRANGHDHLCTHSETAAISRYPSPSRARRSDRP